jgi:hypothetical protein
MMFLLDDARPEMSIYGQTHMHDTNIEALSRQGLSFQNAFAQYASCVPSRASFLTGRRPQKTGVTLTKTYFRHSGGDGASGWNTLPELFRRQGYETAGVGKVFHIQGFQTEESNRAFSTGIPTPRSYSRIMCEYGYYKIMSKYCPIDIPESEIYDSIYTQQMIDLLDRNRNRRFFFTLGFLLPHGPFAVPRRLWNLYSNVPLLQNREFVGEIPLSWNGDTIIEPGNEHSSQTLKRWNLCRIEESGLEHCICNDQEGMISKFSNRHYDSSAILCDPSKEWYYLNSVRKNGSLPFVPQRVMNDFRKGYFAAMTFVDEQIGHVMNKLNSLQITSNTIVVMVSDHGYNLGESNNFRKDNTNYLALRVPLIISVPWLTNSLNKRTRAMFELVDLMPTLASLAGIDLHEDVDGIDQSNIFLQPSVQNKDCAFSQMGKKIDDGSIINAYTIHTNDYRFTKWIPSNNTNLWTSNFVMEELYHISSHCNQGSYDTCERYNVVYTHIDVAERLRVLLRRQFYDLS